MLRQERGARFEIALRPELIMIATPAHNLSAGDYRLVDFLGAGGMGEVYRAVNVRSGQVAAVKILTPSAQAPHLVERFQHEARILAALRHPNIARFYETRRLDTQPCIIMEYVDGQTLAERLSVGGRLALAEALFIIQPVIEAVSYIHQQGVIHRDLKSSNIKIGSAGQVKLLDFGVARTEFSPKLTVGGGVVGTPQYLAPEQLNGEAADGRSDIWALGVILYEMFTGQVPFDATTMGRLCETIRKAEYTAPSLLNPLIPREVEAIIARCLKKNPKDRYQSAEDLLRDITRLAATVAVQIPGERDNHRPRLNPEPVMNLLRAHWRKFAVTAAAAFLILIISLIGFPNNNNDGPGPPPSPTPAPSPASSSVQVVTRIVAEDTLGELEVCVQGPHGAQRGKTPFDFTASPMSRVKITASKGGFEDYVVETEVGTEYRELRIFESKMKRKN